MKNILNPHLPHIHHKAEDSHLARLIRRAIEEDQTVSDLLQNIQVKVQDGVVTLKGIVFSQYQKMIINDKSYLLTGFGKINDQLEVIDELP